MFKRPKTTTEFEWSEYAESLTAGKLRGLVNQMDLTGIPDNATVTWSFGGYDCDAWQIKIKVAND